MQFLLAALIGLLVISGAKAQEVTLYLDVVTYDNQMIDGDARIVSERARPGEVEGKWHLQTTPVRHWEDIFVTLVAPPQDTLAMHYQLTYEKLRELTAPGASLHFVAVVTDTEFGDWVVSEFRRSLNPEPTIRNPTYLMRAHHKAMFLWQARNRHLTLHDLGPYKNDVVLAYWVLRTARDLYEAVGFALSEEVLQVASWTEALLDELGHGALFGSDTAPRAVFQELIDQLNQRDHIILRRTVYSIEKDIERHYLRGAHSRGCEAALQLKTYLEDIGPLQRRLADPDGTYFLRTVSNTALCSARILNRRPIEPGAVDDAMLARAERTVEQLDAMLNHEDFENAASATRNYSWNEATNLENAIADFRRTISGSPEALTEVSVLRR